MSKVEPKPNGNARGCLWLHGNPKDRQFCGHKKISGYSYCQHHKERAFLKTQKTQNEFVMPDEDKERLEW